MNLKKTNRTPFYESLRVSESVRFGFLMKWFIQSILYWIRLCNDSLFWNAQTKLFPAVMSQLLSADIIGHVTHPPLQPVNRECHDMYTGGGGESCAVFNCTNNRKKLFFMEAVSMLRAWWHSPQRLPLRRAIQPAQERRNWNGCGHYIETICQRMC